MFSQGWVYPSYVKFSRLPEELALEYIQPKHRINKLATEHIFHFSSSFWKFINLEAKYLSLGKPIGSIRGIICDEKWKLGELYKFFFK